jgi:hypothetical protein
LNTSTGQRDGARESSTLMLLFFFSPSKRNYIIDQWTTKSLMLLTGGRNLVQLSPGKHAGPTGLNDGETYKRFCEAIDCLAAELKLPGDKKGRVDLFSGRKQPKGWKVAAAR